METNPLRQYFRQPAIYVKLPSGGKYYPKDSLEVTENGEYPVLPMTTMDEITYRTPDALFNGTASVNVIQSCVPNIKNAWHMPSMDIDTVLIAIRIASYGHELKLDTQCTKCASINTFGVDLRTVMERMRAPDYSQTQTLGDLEIYFKPMDYRQINDNNMMQFEDQKMLQMLQDANVNDEDKLRQVGDVLRKITSMTTRALAQNIAMIKTPQATVTEIEWISDWLENCDRSTFSSIRDHIINTKQQGELQPLKIQCPDCQNEYEQPFTLDMANFFADAS
jgi:hypothetical protein